MLLVIRITLSVVISYLIGSIPTAYIFGKKLKGIDIRKHGSGNMGATNAIRVLGKGPGTLVLLIDIAKGIIPTTIMADLLGTTDLWMRLVWGLIAVCGHNWTVFLQFKGGKGIATGLGRQSQAVPPIRRVRGVHDQVWPRAVCSTRHRAVDTPGHGSAYGSRCGDHEIVLVCTR